MSSKRVVRAFLISPLAAPIGYAASLVGMTLARVAMGSGPTSLSSLGQLVAVVALVGVPVAYAAALLGGVPMYLALRHAGLIAPIPLWIGGVVIGGIAALLLAPHLRGELFSVPFPIWVGSLLGLLSADVFRRLLPVEDTPDTKPNGDVAR